MAEIVSEGEREDSGGDAARKRSLLWNAVAFLFGWTLFVYWWWVVLRRTDRLVTWHLVTGLAILTSFLVAFSLIWILYNLRLARRGRRNRSTPYHPGGAFERDKLDRPVVLEDLHALREAAVVVIHAGPEQKLYSEGGAEDLPA